MSPLWARHYHRLGEVVAILFNELSKYLWICERLLIQPSHS